MKMLASAVVAASLSLIAAVPASAQEASATVFFGDLDLSSAAGAATLNTRLLGAIEQVCERPSVRDMRNGAVFNDCKDAAMSNALSQLTARGVFKRGRVTIEG